MTSLVRDAAVVSSDRLLWSSEGRQRPISWSSGRTSLRMRKRRRCRQQPPHAEVENIVATESLDEGQSSKRTPVRDRKMDPDTAPSSLKMTGLKSVCSFVGLPGWKNNSEEVYIEVTRYVEGREATTKRESGLVFVPVIVEVGRRDPRR